MSRSYTLNTEQAKQAESFGKYLSESGKYAGVLTSAKGVISKQKTEGIELSFKTDDGKEANYIQLWTYNSAGEGLHGLKVLNALMTVLRLRDLTPTNGTEDGKQITTFPALTNKRLGLVLQREEYAKNDGSDGYRLLLMAPFDAQSEMTAAEILNKAGKAEALTGILSFIKNNPVRRQKAHATNNQTAPAAGYPEAFDDIPF